MKRLALRALKAAALGIALLWPLYLAIGNLWLHEGGLGKLLNRRPEKLSIHWTSAWTLWPGVVHVRGLEVRQQTRVFQWWLAVDRAAVDVDLWNLQDRELLLGPVQGSGAVFRLRRRLDAPPRKRPGRPELYPPIPGLANPPVRKPEVLYPPRPGRKPWHVRITGMNVDGVREVWIEEVRFAGRARVAGAFDVRARERVEVEPSRAEILAGTVTLGAGPQARPVLAGARGRVEARVDPYDPQRFKGWDVLRFATGRLNLEGKVRSLAFLDVLFRETRWVDLRFTGGTTQADVRLRRGRILPGSRLEARPEAITVSFLDYQAQGDGRLAWWVQGAGSAPEGRVELGLDRFQIQRAGYGQPHVRGRGLLLAAASHAPRIGNLFQPLWVTIEMPGAEVPDLRFYNAYLPERSGLAVTGGTGRMSARFRAAAPDWIGSGDLHLAARGLGAQFQDKRLQGDLEVHTILRRADLLARRFDVTGSQIDLTGVGPAGGAPGAVPRSPWWAHVYLKRGELTPGSPVFLRATLESTLSDSRPLFALMAPTGRTQVLRWVDDLLDVQGIGGTADLTVGRRSFRVDRLAVAGGKAQVQGRFRMANGRPRGILYATLGTLDVGVELADGKRDWKLVQPREWFENYPPFDD